MTNLKDRAFTEVEPGNWAEVEVQPLTARYCGIQEQHAPHRFMAGGYLLACAGEPAPAPREEQPEYVLRLSYREISKIAYLARKHSRTQDKRNRKGDVELLDGIEEKMRRILLNV